MRDFSFQIYANLSRPAGVVVAEEFSTPDPIIDDFFQSLTALRSYWPKHDTVASQAHSWFLEIAAGGEIIQISCYISSRKGDIIVGEVGKFSEESESHYGYFQSRELFQWYQTYSHRWLNPPTEGDREKGR